ncbi:hypothetical protein HK098_003919 [Nowakowskiella sp. JEL0407]|nr:hypothetical protein HK098_003919 [Nowakowskiella sp. JEL0407]
MSISYDNNDNIYHTQQKFNNLNINSTTTHASTDLSNDSTKISISSDSSTTSTTPLNGNSEYTPSSSATIGNNITPLHPINIDLNVKNGSRIGVGKSRVQSAVLDTEAVNAAGERDRGSEILKDVIDTLLVITIYVLVNLPWSWLVSTYTITSFLVALSLMVIPIVGVPVYLGMAWTWRWCARINCVILSAVVPNDPRYPGVLVMPAIDFTVHLGPKPTFREVFNSFALAKSTWGVVVYFVLKPFYVTFASCLMVTLGVTGVIVLPLFWIFGLLSWILKFFHYLAIMERRFTMSLTGAVVVKDNAV